MGIFCLGAFSKKRILRLGLNWKDSKQISNHIEWKLSNFLTYVYTSYFIQSEMALEVMTLLTQFSVNELFKRLVP